MADLETPIIVLPLPFVVGASKYGSIRFDLSIPADVRSRHARLKMLALFMARIASVTEVEAEDFPKLAQYMVGRLTAPPAKLIDPKTKKGPEFKDNPNSIPPSVDGMQDKLNGILLPKLCDWIKGEFGRNSIELDGCVVGGPTPAPAYYCVGTDGQHYCYAGLPIENNTTGLPMDPIVYGNYRAEIILAVTTLVEPAA